MDDKILVPLDGSPTSARIVQGIIREKSRFFGPLTLLHVIDEDKIAYRMIPDFQIEMIRDSARKAAKHLLETLQQELERDGLRTEIRIVSGSPRQVVCRIANDENFSLLILGRRGAGEIRDVLFGTVSNYALHNVRCPVMLF
ncbi:universal stress protein [Trichloromonas sp.]|uniref:universal stress protein n=1 Tax=Trichloromonas sp. TaxID=3069249 RepID=UPI003D81A8C7